MLKALQTDPKAGWSPIHSAQSSASGKSFRSGGGQSGRSSSRGVSIPFFAGTLPQDDSVVGLQQLWEELMGELESSDSDSSDDGRGDGPGTPLLPTAARWAPHLGPSPAAQVLPSATGPSMWPGALLGAGAGREPGAGAWPFQPQRCLPPGWECRWDNAQGRYYYLDHRTRTSQWDPPAPSMPQVKTNL